MSGGELRVLVTGASSGIGRASALELARRGHQVIAAARRLAALEELARTNRRIVPTPLDLTDRASIAEAARAVREATDGAPDVLVNAAGFALIGPVEALPPEAVERQFATNVFGLLELTRTFLPRMRERRRGSVINVSSVVGRFAMPGMGAYSASKHALEALSDSLRMELAPFGVSVVLVEPSWVATDIAEGSARQAGVGRMAGVGYEDLVTKTHAYIARQMERSSLQPERVARLVADVAAARRPRPRYLVPAKARLQVQLLRSLPTHVADRGKRRALGG